jgi:hypothetical protein
MVSFPGLHQRHRMHRQRLTFIIFASLFCFLSNFTMLPSGEAQTSQVRNNVFISSENPTLRLSVDKKLKYLGSFPFQLGQEVEGHRYIFVRADSKKRVQQMFIVQQEGFLPASQDSYRYQMTHPVRLGDEDYQHSVIFDDVAARIREEPGKEADLTQRFLDARGYSLSSELVMTRFARPVDSAHRHEIILFCFEPLSSYQHKLADFADDLNGSEKQKIKQQEDQNCLKSFQVH